MGTSSSRMGEFYTKMSMKTRLCNSCNKQDYVYTDKLWERPPKHVNQSEETWKAVFDGAKSIRYARKTGYIDGGHKFGQVWGTDDLDALEDSMGKDFGLGKDYSVIRMLASYTVGTVLGIFVIQNFQQVELRPYTPLVIREGEAQANQDNKEEK